jgi:transposase
MTIQRVEVITGRERRRQFTEAEKLRLVGEAFRPGVKATVAARREGVDVSLLYRWRRQLFGRLPRLPAFVPVTVAGGEPSRAAPGPAVPDPRLPPAGVLEIEFATGTRLRISGAVDPAVVTAAIAALSRPA